MCDSKAEGGQRCYSTAVKRLDAAAKKWRTAAEARDDAEKFYANDPDDREAFSRLREATENLQEAHAKVTTRRVELASTPQGENELRAQQVSAAEYKPKMEVIARGRALRDRNTLVKKGGLSRQEADSLSDTDATQKLKELETAEEAPAREAARAERDARRARIHEYVDAHGTEHAPAGQEPRTAPARALREGDVLSNGFVVAGTEPSRTPRKVKVVGAYKPRTGQERQIRAYEWGRDTNVTVRYNAAEAMQQNTGGATATVGDEAETAPNRFAATTTVNELIDGFDHEASMEHLSLDGERSADETQEEFEKVRTERDSRLTQMGQDLPASSTMDLSPAERAIVHSQGWDDTSVRGTLAGCQSERDRVDALFHRAAEERWFSLARSG